MTDKQLLMKIKLDANKDGSISVKTNLSSWAISYHESLHNIISWSLSILREDTEVGKLLWAKSDFSNLQELIMQGFILRIDRASTGYSLIVSKDKCSTSFSVMKENGIGELLVQAEDWAETMLEELNKTNLN